jgi:hypothetical protein
LIALLAATVLMAALWFVALKPSGSSGPGSGGKTSAGYPADIAAAHRAVQTSAADNARSGADPASGPPTPAQASTGGAAASTASSTAHVSTTPAAKTKHATKATHSAARSARTAEAAHRVTAGARLSTVQRAMRTHKVVAMLFYNPAAADDQAVKQELAAVPTHRGRVVKLVVPLSEIANYTAVTEQVPVNFSPTLVLVASNGQADEIVGFSDQFEIAQRVDDALAVK